MGEGSPLSQKENSGALGVVAKRDGKVHRRFSRVLKIDITVLSLSRPFLVAYTIQLCALLYLKRTKT